MPPSPHRPPTQAALHEYLQQRAGGPRRLVSAGLAAALLVCILLLSGRGYRHEPAVSVRGGTHLLASWEVGGEGPGCKRRCSLPAFPQVQSSSPPLPHQAPAEQAAAPRGPAGAAAAGGGRRAGERQRYSYLVLTSSHKTGTVQLLCLSRIIRNLLGVKLETHVSGSICSCSRSRAGDGFRGESVAQLKRRLCRPPTNHCCRWATRRHPRWRPRRPRRAPPPAAPGSCWRCCRWRKSAMGRATRGSGSSAPPHG